MHNSQKVIRKTCLSCSTVEEQLDKRMSILFLYFQLGYARGKVRGRPSWARLVAGNKSKMGKFDYLVMSTIGGSIESALYIAKFKNNNFRLLSFTSILRCDNLISKAFTFNVQICWSSCAETATVSLVDELAFLQILLLQICSTALV